MKQDRYRLAWVVVFLVVGFVALGGLSRFFGAAEKVAWREDLAQARSEAASAGKPVFLYFTASWCGPCQQMKRSTWADQQVADALAAGYVPVKVDIDRQPALAQDYNVETIPWFGILDANGRGTKAFSGALGSEEFLGWLKG